VDLSCKRTIRCECIGAYGSCDRGWYLRGLVALRERVSAAFVVVGGGSTARGEWWCVFGGSCGTPALCGEW
jgi:acetone carboxylase gamma subunit